MRRWSMVLVGTVVLAACGPPTRGGGRSSGRSGGSPDAGSTTDAGSGLDAGGLSCLSHADCPTGTFCEPLSGECLPEQWEPPDAGGTRPDAGSTGPDAGVTPGPTCGSKYDCADGEVCRGQRCGAPSPSCNADADCPRGEICNFSKVCEAGCVDPRDCDAPSLCHPQRFACEGCSLANPCPSGTTCLDGACRTATSCSTTQGCVNAGQDGAVCIGGACSGCSGHADCAVEPYRSPQRICASDGLCRVVACSDAACRDSLGPRGWCDTVANACAQRECLADPDCGSGVCDLASYTCRASSCTGAAQSRCQSDCGNQGTTCNTATCACAAAPGGEGAACTTSADCVAPYGCGLGVCSEVPVDPLTGDPCVDVFTCLSCVGNVTGRPCDPMGCLMASQFGTEPICL